MNRGRMKYVPRVIIEEIEDLKTEKGLMSDSDAFREMAQHSQVGREVERMLKFRFNHKPRGRPKRGGFLF